MSYLMIRNGPISIERSISFFGMEKKFLNVVYQEIPAEIETTDLTRLGQLQDAIKAKYGPVMAQIGAPQLQFHKSNPDDRIESMADFTALPNDFFVEKGKKIEIRISPTASLLNLQNLSQPNGKLM